VTIWAGNPLQYTITKKKSSHFILYRAGRLVQLDHLKKKPINQKKKKKEKKEKEEKRKGFHNYSSLQTLLYKVKRK
jgi:hypothetical protein